MSYHFESMRVCAPPTSTFATCFSSTRRAASSASPTSAPCCSTPWRWACCASELIDTLGVTAARARPDPLRLRARLAHRRGPRARRCRGTATRSGSGPAAGCTRCRGWCASSRPPGTRRTGAKPIAFAVWQRHLRGRAAPAAPGPRRRAGVLDADRLRQRLPVARARPRHLLHGGALPRQGRRGVPAGRPARRGVGRGLRRSPAVLREGLPGSRARRR